MENRTIKKGEGYKIKNKELFAVRIKCIWSGILKSNFQPIQSKKQKQNGFSWHKLKTAVESHDQVTSWVVSTTRTRISLTTASLIQQYQISRVFKKLYNNFFLVFFVYLYFARLVSKSQKYDILVAQLV